MLEFDGATKRFGSLTALDSCTFSATPGRLTGFLGRNGAGKTTAMRSVFGLVELDGGAVRWCGGPIGAAERARFGYMPEERGLYPWMRVRDQLLYLGSLGLRDRVQTARSVDRWLERLGLGSRGGDRVDTLSHGNQQRVQLVAALVGAPELLILDEPFAGLDPLAITSLGELLREVADDGVTVLFSSHQLDLVEDICEDVVIIDGGRVVHAGDLSQLRASAPDRLVEVHYAGAVPDLAGVAGLPGVEVLATDAGRVRLRVGRDTDVGAVVGRLNGSSEVVSFGYRPPSLTELFREAVGP